LLLNGTVLVTGQVDRVTDFEKGFPIQTARSTDGGWEPDPWIWDDQAVVVNVRDRGLVVLSGCSHAGAVNVLRYAQALTGVSKVHAFVGGMHLTGGLFEPIIPRTIAELVAIGPDVVVPGHCTGWRAANLLVTTLPDAYVQSNVGTRLHFAAPEVGGMSRGINPPAQRMRGMGSHEPSLVVTPAPPQPAPTLPWAQPQCPKSTG